MMIVTTETAHVASVLVFNEAFNSGENAATITRVAASAACFEMSFIIRLNSVSFRALITDPLFMVAVLTAEVFFDSNKIAKCMAWVVVETGRFWAYKNPLPNHRIFSLQQLPRHFMPPSVHLQVLVSLKSLIADLADVSVRF